MCIQHSVGVSATNDQRDVRSIQWLLLLNGQLPSSGAADGRCGPVTIAAIRSYQAAGGLPVSGRVAPGDATLAALRPPHSADLPLATLGAVMAGADAGTVARFHLPLVAAMGKYGIDTPLRQAHVLAQIGHESGDLRYVEELANGSAYDGRRDLGNTEPGDGPRFKGRGLIQLTGRANYSRYGQAIGQDLVSGDNPQRVARDLTLAADVAGWFWAVNQLNTQADADDLRAVTKRINGGLNGLADRQARLDRAKWLLGV